MVAGWTLKVLATSLIDLPSWTRARARVFWSGRSFAGRPNDTPAPLGGLAPLVGAVPDQRTLELGDAGEHRQHHAPGRCGGIRPGLLKRL